MGLFTRKTNNESASSAPTTAAAPALAAGLDLATGPIDRIHNRHLVDPPDFMELTDSLISEANSPCDRMIVLSRVLAIAHQQAGQFLTALNRQHVAAGLQVIIARPDFDGSMFWNYLTQHGPQVFAVHNGVAELLRSDRTRDAIVGAIRSGAMTPES